MVLYYIKIWIYKIKYIQKRKKGNCSISYSQQSRTPGQRRVFFNIHRIHSTARRGTTKDLFSLSLFFLFSLLFLCFFSVFLVRSRYARGGIFVYFVFAKNQRGNVGSEAVTVPARWHGEGKERPPGFCFAKIHAVGPGNTSAGREYSGLTPADAYFISMVCMVCTVPNGVFFWSLFAKMKKRVEAPKGHLGPT